MGRKSNPIKHKNENFEVATPIDGDFHKNMLLFLEEVKVIDGESPLDVNVLQRRYDNYKRAVAKYGMRISNLQMYGALGLNKQQVYNILSNRTKAPQSVKDFLTKCKIECSMYREASVLKGEMNPVLYIFQAKNFDGMSDQQEVMIVNDDGGAKSERELIDKYENRTYKKKATTSDDVIDVDVEEVG